MHPPGADTVVVRHGEVGVKSPQVQHAMERRLRNNLAGLLADREVPGDVAVEHGRLYVHTSTDAVAAAARTASDTFGVVSASPAIVVEPTLDAICGALAAAAREHYDSGSFAVRARRAGEREAHPYASTDLEREGGAAVWKAAEATGVAPEVDLDSPDYTFSVEARPERAFVFCEKRPGPGGLPLGSQAPLVVLLSGGIDSPVAAWEAMTRGSPVYPLYVDLGDYGGPDHRARAAATVDDLRTYAPDLTMRVAPGGEGIDRLVEAMDALRMLSVRRFLFAIAAAVADDLDAVGIVTGEAVGQKSSQTATNLAVTSAAVDLPVHRPLLTMDKSEITARAREIGTFDDATIPAGCNRVAPSLPETAATIADVREAEPDDLFELAREAADRVERVE